MRALVWSLRILVFLVLFAFAVKNTDPVALRFFFGSAWQAPMIVILFVFFAAGVLSALLAVAPLYVRLRREAAVARGALRPGATERAVPSIADGVEG